MKTLLAQYVAGFLGASTEHRGRNADQDAAFSLIELQDLLDEWIVGKSGWQNRKHDGLAHRLYINKPSTGSPRCSSKKAAGASPPRCADPGGRCDG